MGQKENLLDSEETQHTYGYSLFRKQKGYT